MLLRKATKEDFEICNKLDENMFDDVLFFERSRYDKSSKQVSLTDMMAPEDSEYSLSEMEFTKTKFYNHIESDYVKIFVFEDDENVIGYVRMFCITRFRWKLETMQVLEDYQTEEVIAQILTDLLKENSIREVDVCATNKEMQERLHYLGYQESSKSSWYFLIKEELE